MTQYRNSKWLNLTAAAALLLAVLILFQFLYQKDNKYTNGPPYGSQGVFTFSARDLTGSRPLFLIDGWEFYPDQLLTPDTIGSAPDQSVSFIFIGQYSNFSFLSSGHSPFGRATYRLLLQYDGEPRLLTLEVPELFTDYQLWINGQPVEQGSPFAAFYMDGTAEILLNTDNRSHYYSGLTYPPALGTPEAVHRMLFLRHVLRHTVYLSPGPVPLRGRCLENTGQGQAPDTFRLIMPVLFHPLRLSVHSPAGSVRKALVCRGGCLLDGYAV